MTNPVQVDREIREILKRYVDTQYRLKWPGIMSSRNTLFEEQGYINADVFLEPVLPYDAEYSFAELQEEAQLDPAVSEIVGRALFGRFYPTADSPIFLRSHQAEAMK